MAIQKYFYVYDKRLAKFLRYKRNIVWECHALHPKTHSPFWQFLQSQELRNAVDEFIEQN